MTYHVLLLLAHLVSGQECSSLLQRVPDEHAGPTQMLGSPSERIPCIIHQTWKTHRLEGEQVDFAETWKQMNPSCEYKLWNDTEVEQFVAETSADLIWPLWQGLKPVERADVFRYLVVYEQGGYYADVDVSCTRPIREYPVPTETQMIVGYQGGYRMPGTKPTSPLQRVEQFEQWFFASAPRNPVLRRTLELVVQKFHWRVHNPCEMTGPATFSDAIHEYLEKASDQAMADEVSLRKLELEGVVLGEVSYPPEKLYGSDWKIWIFAAGRVSSEKTAKADPRYEFYSAKEQKIVQHHYAGTWWREPKKL